MPSACQPFVNLPLRTAPLNNFSVVFQFVFLQLPCPSAPFLCFHSSRREGCCSQGSAAPLKGRNNPLSPGSGKPPCISHKKTIFTSFYYISTKTGKEYHRCFLCRFFHSLLPQLVLQISLFRLASGEGATLHGRAASSYFDNQHHEMQNKSTRCKSVVRLHCLMLHTESVIFTSPDLTQAFHNMNLQQKEKSEQKYCKCDTFNTFTFHQKGRAC